MNGKRPWRGNLKERYEQLVDTSVNTPGGVSQLLGSSLTNSKDLPLSRPLPNREWCRGRDSNPYATFVAADFKSAASAIPPPRL